MEKRLQGHFCPGMHREESNYAYVCFYWEAKPFFSKSKTKMCWENRKEMLPWALELIKALWEEVACIPGTTTQLSSCPDGLCLPPDAGLRPHL